jgi:uncharacterized protein (DUF433 family)
MYKDTIGYASKKGRYFSMLIENLGAQPPPIQFDENSTCRVVGTRVRLETVIEAFNNGYTAEEILFKYPSLNLIDVYALITYYLWHREEVDSYIEERHQVARNVRQENENRFPSRGVRERLLARKRT